MKTILITGQGGSGKSRSLYLTANWLSNYYQELSGILPKEFLFTGNTYEENGTDLKTLFRSGEKTILFHAATDDGDCIQELKTNLDSLAARKMLPDLLVTTCRRFDDENAQILLNTMEWKRKGNKVFDTEGNEIIQVPVIPVKYDRKKNEIIEWYNELTSDVVCNFIQLSLFD